MDRKDPEVFQDHPVPKVRRVILEQVDLSLTGCTFTNVNPFDLTNSVDLTIKDSQKD